MFNSKQFKAKEGLVVGFTGTQKGMTLYQKKELVNILNSLRPYPYYPYSTQFHHGDCIGADKEAESIARGRLLSTWAHPANNVSEYKKAHCPSHNVLLSRPALERNHDIVNAAGIMIACPGEYGEIIRSGTWATIRYARKCKKPLIIIYPNGKWEVNS